MSVAGALRKEVVPTAAEVSAAVKSTPLRSLALAAVGGAAVAAVGFLGTDLGAHARKERTKMLSALPIQFTS